MLKIKETQIEFQNKEEALLFRKALVEQTFKSNLNYNFVFQFLFANGSDKIFVGNWIDQHTFWAIRKGKFYLKFRPLLLTIGRFDETELKLKLTVKMPFSTICSFVGFCLLSFFLIAYTVGVFALLFFPLSIILYFLFLIDEADSTALYMKAFLAQER